MAHCMTVYLDPDEPRLTDVCRREPHEDPIHEGRVRDLEWTEEVAEGRSRSRHSRGTKMLRRAVPEPLEPALPLD